MAEERYFHIPPECISGSRFTLDNHESHHLLQVLRLPADSEIWLLNGTGVAYKAKFTTVNDGKVAGVILEEFPSYGESSVPVHLAFGLIKRDRFELLLEKGTELGVRSFYPLIMDRSIKRDVNLLRSKKIITAAAKQCGRSFFPEIHEPVALDTWLKTTVGMKRIFFHGEETTPLAPLLEQWGDGVELQIVIGPEGDFSHRELELLRQNHLKSVSLGSRRLRTETAGLAALAIVNEFYQFKGGPNHG